jgi:hypothetical protein
MKKWSLIVTRETTLFERALRVLGYYHMFGRTGGLSIKNILVVSHHNLTQQYFDSQEKRQRLAKMWASYKNQSFKKLSRNWNSYPQELKKSLNTVARACTARNLQNFFETYFYGRGIVLYTEELAEILESKKIKNADIPRLGYWHETAETKTSAAFDSLKKIIAKECKKKNIPTREGFSYMPDEFLGLLKNNKEIAASVIKKRNTYYVMRMNEGKIKLWLGKTAQLIEGRNLGVSSTGDIKGLVAYPGYIRGRVRIINKVEQIKKMKKGEVLVSVMTNPRLVSAFKKAAAVVTDEGGIICHAAIVPKSRSRASARTEAASSARATREQYIAAYGPSSSIAGTSAWIFFIPLMVIGGLDAISGISPATPVILSLSKTATILKPMIVSSMLARPGWRLGFTLSRIVKLRIL